MSQLFLDLAAVSAKAGSAPGHHRAIISDGCKGTGKRRTKRGLDALDMCELLSHVAALSATTRIPPSDCTSALDMPQVSMKTRSSGFERLE